MSSNFGQIPPLTSESEKSNYNVVATLAPPFLIGSSLFLQVARTILNEFGFPPDLTTDRG